LGLTLNERKTSIRNARQERLDFLGYTFGPHFSRRLEREYIGSSPSKKSVKRITEKEHMLVYEDRKIDATRRKPLDQYLRCLWIRREIERPKAKQLESISSPAMWGHGKKCGTG